MGTDGIIIAMKRMSPVYYQNLGRSIDIFTSWERRPEELKKRDGWTSIRITKDNLIKGIKENNPEHEWLWDFAEISDDAMIWVLFDW